MSSLYKEGCPSYYSGVRAVLISRFISLTGTNMTTVALPWFVLATTGSTTKMGLVLSCQTLPAFALGIPGGSVVAMLGARRSLVLGDALRVPLLEIGRASCRERV